MVILHVLCVAELVLMLAVVLQAAGSPFRAARGRHVWLAAVVLPTAIAVYGLTLR